MAHIERKPNGAVRITVSDGYDIKGKQIKRRKTIPAGDLAGMTPRQREKEITRLAVEFESTVKSGLYLDGETVTLAQFVEFWLENYAEKEYSPKYLHETRRMLNLRIIPALGHLRLGKIKPAHLLDFFDVLSGRDIRLKLTYKLKAAYKEVLAELSAAGLCDARTRDSLTGGLATTEALARKLSAAAGVPLSKMFSAVGKDKPLAQKTIKNYHTLLSTILQTAVYWQVITDNPARRIKPPKHDKTEAAYYDDEDVAALFTALEGEPLKYRLMVLLGVYCGLRLGEICALEWTDINADEGTLTVSKAMQYIPKKGIFEKPPKTKAGKRVVSLPASLLPLFAVYKERQNADAEICGDKWKNTGKIFTTDDGGLIAASGPSTWFHKFLARHNLPPLPFHGLRHTSASLAIASGADIAALSRRLGHSNPSITLNTYSHALKQADRDIADKIEKRLDENAKKKLKKAMLRLG